VSDHDPVELAERELRGTQSQPTLAEMRARDLEARTREAIWLMSGPRGRSHVRRTLREASIDILHATPHPSFNQNHGQLCFNEGQRARAFGLLLVLVRALATGELKLEHWQLLLTENDDG
jgi:hypothetical protein